MGRVSRAPRSLAARPAAGLTHSRPRSGPEAAIARAAVAPFQAALHHEAAALCGALVPAVAAELVQGSAPGASCTAAASRDFALTAPNEPRAEPGLSVDPTVQNLEAAGQHATLKLSFTFVTTVGEKSGTTESVIHSAGPIKLELEEVDGAWLVSSRATLGTLPGCLLSKPRRCRSGARVLLFLAGEVEATQPGLELPTPAAVERAGGRELSEFEAGKRVLARSGCLACHRIGDNGNRGPGPNLTNVGSKLSERAIAHALADPRAPMPSFRRLPPRRFHDIVRFLALLR